MPVIRGKLTRTALPTNQRKAIVSLLEQERHAGTPDGPVIFEIPLEQANKMDVVVIWQGWQGIRSGDRTDAILAAYKDQKEKVALALGVTYQEALEDQLLPYAVVPMSREDEVDQTKLRQAMIDEGGIILPEGKVDLRLPTMKMAEAAYQRLGKRIPKGHWSIVETAGPIG